jgi:cell division protein ZapA
MNNTLSINIKIDNRIYPLVVNRNDEKRYRDAAKELNEIIHSFRNDYPDKDSQDVHEKENADQSPLISDLKDLRDDITDFLQERNR